MVMTVMTMQITIVIRVMMMGDFNGDESDGDADNNSDESDGDGLLQW